MPVQLQTMDWTVLVIAVVAAIGAYIGGRWREQGRIDAITNSIAKVVEQETAKAFAQEKGKQDAISANLHNLDLQMRTLTTTQEQIKSQISGELWERQWRLNQKRDAYANLLIALSRLADVHLKAGVHILRGGHLESDYKDPIHNALAELRRAGAVADVFCTPEAMSALKDVFSPPSSNEEHKLDEYTHTLGEALDRISVECKRDLGLPTATP
jgi:hypothetical protein